MLAFLNELSVYVFPSTPGNLKSGALAPTGSVVCAEESNAKSVAGASKEKHKKARHLFMAGRFLKNRRFSIGKIHESSASCTRQHRTFLFLQECNGEFCF